MELFFNLDLETSRQDALRRLIGFASDYGKSLVSSQTNFFHYYGPQVDYQQAIPFLDNVHLALIWMRTHIAENVQLAKDLLSRLLHFQCGANFPCYLHEFPQCNDKFLGIRVLFPLALILKHYGYVLGIELNQQIMQTCEKLVAEAVTQSRLTPLLRIKLACSLAILDQKPLEYIEDQGWDRFPIETCAKIALCLYGVQTHLKNWPYLWNRLNNSWISSTACYGGIPDHIKQYQYLPQITSYELLMWYLYGKIPARTDLPFSHVLLQAAYLPWISEDELPKETEQNLVIKTLSKKETLLPHEDPFFHSLYSLWGTSDYPQTFVCQVAPQVRCEVKKTENTVELEFSFVEEFVEKDESKAGEINFYLNRPKTDSVIMTVDSKGTNTFRQNEQLCIQIEQQRLYLTFVAQDSNSLFIGHCFPGNRLSQSACSVKYRFCAYDWQISLRTLHRSLSSKVKVLIDFCID